MQINFKEMEVKELKHFKGGEKSMLPHMYLDDKNRILLSRLIPGASIGLHKHEGSSEIIYFLKGKGKVLEDGHWTAVQPGYCHYCQDGSEHAMNNDSDGDLIFFAVVPQHG